MKEYEDIYVAVIQKTIRGGDTKHYIRLLRYSSCSRKESNKNVKPVGTVNICLIFKIIPKYQIKPLTAVR